MYKFPTLFGCILIERLRKRWLLNQSCCRWRLLPAVLHLSNRCPSFFISASLLPLTPFFFFLASSWICSLMYSAGFYPVLSLLKLHFMTVVGLRGVRVGGLKIAVCSDVRAPCGGAPGRLNSDASRLADWSATQMAHIGCGDRWPLCFVSCNL